MTDTTNRWDAGAIVFLRADEQPTTGEPLDGAGTVAVAPAGVTAGATGPAAVTRIDDTLEVLTSKANFWANALSIEHDRLSTWQQRLGYPVVIITALTGIAAFSQLESNPAWWATLTVAVAAFAAAALSAVQTQANFAARATTAAEYSAKFGKLYGKMLRAGDRLQAGAARDDSELDALYAEYEALKDSRPPVSQRVRSQAHATVAQEASSMRAQAEARSR